MSSSAKKNRFNNGLSTASSSNAAAATTTTTTTASSMDEAINRMIDIPASSSSAAAASSEIAEFIPSSTWKGSKDGYYFGTSKEYGTGYHLDHYQNKKREGNKNKRSRNAVQFSSKNEPRDITQQERKPKKRQKTGEELLAEAEANLQSAASSASAALPRILDISSPSSIQNATTSLHRSIAKNQMKRAQFADDPSKFMDSEVNLHDEIMSWKSIATDVLLYSLLLSTGGTAGGGKLKKDGEEEDEKNVLQSFLSLLHHENSDVSMSVLNVFVELLDVTLLQEEETNKEEEEEEVEQREEKKRICMGMLGNAIVSGGRRKENGEGGGGCGLDLIVSNLGRLTNDDEDVSGVDDILTIMESLMDLDRMGILQEAAAATGGGSSSYQSPAASILRDTTLLSWLLKFVSNNKKQQGSSNSPLKLHASEVLASLLQNEEATRLYAKNISSLPPFSSPFDDDDDDDETDKGKKKKKKSKKPKVVDGIENLLQSIAPYRKKDPETEEECEILENIFDALAAVLFSCPTNVEPFLEAQGIELMLRCLREKVHAGGGSLRVLNFVLSGGSGGDGSSRSMGVKKEDGEEQKDMENGTPVYKRACEQFVDAGGLKVLFPLFMGRGSAIPNPAKCSDGGSALATKAGERLREQRENANKGSNGNLNENRKGLTKRERRALHARKEWLYNVETNSIQIMYALTKHLDDSSAHDAKARLLVKFVESDCEKCDRLIELCLKYSEKMRLEEYRYYRSDEAEEAENAGIDVDLAALHAKLKGGGDIFHRVGAITAFAAVGSKRCHEHIIEQLTVRNSGISVVKESIEEFASMLEEGSQKSQLQYYLDTI